MQRDVIVALDFNSGKKAIDFVDQFDHEIYVKVGMELFYKEGPSIIKALKERGHKIFLDLKLHDIPNTVTKASLSLLDLDVDIINYHIAGGREMLESANKAVKENKKDMITLGITMLTSTSEEQMHDDILIDKNKKLKDVVVSYAKTAKEAGLNGVVCSALEVEDIKENVGKDFLCVTPGIRLGNEKKDDQKRVVTPEMARKFGSDFIVVGRPITQAKDPVKAYNEIKNMFLGE